MFFLLVFRTYSFGNNYMNVCVSRFVGVEAVFHGLDKKNTDAKKAGFAVKSA